MLIKIKSQKILEAYGLKVADIDNFLILLKNQLKDII